MGVTAKEKIMKKTTKIIGGIILIAVGIIFALNTLNITNVNIFFDGWWTLFIIVPCFIGLFTEKDKVGNLMGILLGAVLLLACQDIINFDLLWKLLVPAVIVVMGIKLVLGGILKSKKNAPPKVSQSQKNFAVFSGNDVDFSGESFDGGDYIAIFGGIEVHLENAIIDHDVTVNATAIFGGIDIFLPENVKVKVSSASVFGGVGNERKGKTSDSSVTVYINGSGIFGGVDVK